MFWWVELGYPPFAPGKDKFPRTGQVIKHYREQKMNDKGKPWRQRDLARVLRISEQAVRDIENKDAAMDHDRRHFLSKLFDIPPVLLGIVTLEEILGIIERQRHDASPPVVSTPTSTTHKLIVDPREYSGMLSACWATDHSYTAQTTLASTLLRINTLYRELSRVRGNSLPSIYELLCGYHQFTANLLRDRQLYDDSVIHLNKAFKFAKALNSNELKALVLHRRGNILCDADRIEDALRDYEEARQYRIPDYLKGPILLHAGHVGAKAAKPDKDKQRAALVLIDQGGNMARVNRDKENPYFLDFSTVRYHLNKAAALIDMGWNKDALSELSLVDGGPEYMRRQAYTDILQAQAYTNRGAYPLVVDLVEPALLIVQEINSQVNIARVAIIHQQLQQSSYRNNPDVARLGYLLGE